MFVVIYLGAGCLITVISYKEYQFIEERFSQMVNNPAKKVCQIGFLYGFSFLIRTILNLWAFVDTKSLTNIQMKSCEDNTAGWAALVGFIHLFGEVLPLSSLFYLQTTKTLTQKKYVERVDESDEWPT